MKAIGSYRQAIQTKYHGPTDARGSRVSARCEAGRITVPWDHALNSCQNHESACLALLQKLQWSGTYVGGCLPDGSYVWTDAIGAGLL